MVEFNFDLKPLFPTEIIKITSRDFYQSNYDDDQIHKISQLETIINRMGQLSAVAQNLKAPITSAEILKYSDNTKLYLMAILQGQGQGQKDAVVGLLKVGKKDLFLYDETKQQRKCGQVPCILDFYIYEYCQRSGYGKKLFERMLKEENLQPNKCSIDRPSEKLTGFLKKHYGLEKTIPQGYKFVLYKGFFDENNEVNTQAGGGSASSDFAPPTKPVDYKPKKASISAEHFGACLDVYNISRCNRKFQKHRATERPYSMVEVMQTLNKK